MITGKWSGYEIDFEYNGHKYRLKTRLGVRGFNIPVRVNEDNFRAFKDGKEIEIVETLKVIGK